MEIRKTKKRSFLSHVRNVCDLVTHKFLSQPSSTTRLPVQRTAKQETGRNMEGVEKEEGRSVCVSVCMEFGGLVKALP